MRPGDRVTFDIEGVQDGNNVLIGCERFTMDQLTGTSKRVKVAQDRTVTVKRARGVVGEDGRVEFPGIQRRFLPQHIEGRATNLKVKKSKAADVPDVMVGVSMAALHTALRWQAGDRIVWDEPGNTGPRVRRDDGLWYREATGRTGIRRGWTDRYYDEKIRQGQVKILRKGGVDVAHA